MAVTLVPQAARSQRAGEAGCWELVAHAARRALLVVACSAMTMMTTEVTMAMTMTIAMAVAMLPQTAC